MNYKVLELLAELAQEASSVDRESKEVCLDAIETIGAVFGFDMNEIYCGGI